MSGEALRLDFDRRLTLQFRGSRVTLDAGLLVYRVLDDALGLSAKAVDILVDARTGKNGRHALGLAATIGVRVSCMNGAERLRHDPEMCRIVGGKAPHASAASPGQMGRFENKWLAAEKNFSALANLSGRWIDAVHGRRPPRGVVPAMDSSVSQTQGGIGVHRLERSLCLHLPPFLVNPFGDLERCSLCPGNVHSADWVERG